jgi:hypothetical protein
VVLDLAVVGLDLVVEEEAVAEVLGQQVSQSWKRNLVKMFH